VPAEAKKDAKGEFRGKTHQRLVQMSQEHIRRVQNNRKEWEIKAYVNLMMKEGYHYINDRGRRDIRDPNQLRRIINKFRSTLRALKNAVTYNMPIVDVLPERGQESIDQAELDLASYVCTGEFQKNNMRDVLRTLIEDSALKSWGCMSVLPNDDYSSPDDPIVKIQIYDPFDVFFDHHDPCKAQMFVVSSADKKNRLRSMGYDLSSVANTMEARTHSVLKNEFERMEGLDPDPETLLIDTVFMMDYGVEDNEITDATEPVVAWFVKCGDTIIKEPEVLEGYRDLGDIFFLYYMEQSQHIKYPTPWATDAVPMQRSLNEASENLDTLSHWYSKVRLLQQMGESNYTQMFEDKHVQIVKYEGQRPEFATPPNVPQELFGIVAQREAQIEDMIGMHAASMGKLVSAGASGRLQALAQAADMDNVNEAVINLQTFLERVFKRVLEVASDNVDQVTRFYGTSEEDNSILAIGEAAYKTLAEEEQKRVKPIRKFQNVRTIVIPGNMFMVQQNKQEVLEMLPILVNAGLNEEAEAMFQVFMRLFAPGGSRDIAKALQRKTKEVEEQNAEIKIIQFEIVLLARGEKVTATPEQPHEMHIQLKLMALQAIVEKYGEDSDVAANMKENIAQHTAMMEAPPTEVPPVPAGAQGGSRPLLPASQVPAAPVA
jgi:hypothetical protein